MSCSTWEASSWEQPRWLHWGVQVDPASPASPLHQQMCTGTSGHQSSPPCQSWILNTLPTSAGRAEMVNIAAFNSRAPRPVTLKLSPSFMAQQQVQRLQECLQLKGTCQVTLSRPREADLPEQHYLHAVSQWKCDHTQHAGQVVMSAQAPASSQ
jgi:hypothetical protein